MPKKLQPSTQREKPQSAGLSEKSLKGGAGLSEKSLKGGAGPSRKNNSYEVTKVLKEQGYTAKEFAEYLGKSPEQMSYWFKQGVDQSLENNIICFLAHKKGVELTISGIKFT
ncbi:MAG: hypothetical protein ACRC6O_13460 [Flavobacterium sp.]